MTDGAAPAVRPTEPVVADYEGACVANLVPALLGRGDAGWLPEPVEGARTVVLLVLDGLGWHALQEHAQRMPVLHGLVGRPITTVVPSTTAAALTSITTGLAPSAHGLVGYRVLVDGDVLNVLGWQASDGRRAPDPTAVQRHPPFLGRQVPVVTLSRFATSGFTRAHLRDQVFCGWTAPSSLVEHCRRLARTGASLVYAYYPGIDEVAHEHGLHDGFYAAELRAVDRLVDDLVRALPDEVALVVTSDHGQVHVGPDGWLALGPARPLVVRAWGDGRFRYLEARPGAAAELVGALRDELGPRAWVLSRAELLDRRWLGPELGPSTRRRIGDVVVAARDDVALIDPWFPRETGLVSAHGSVTEAEMLVPCLATRGQG